jgi:acetoin utilization deacetylase AcuC-like enzyme
MTSSAPLTIISDQRYLQHDTGGGDHPEIPERLHTIHHALQTSDYSSSLSYISTQVANREWLTKAHTENWLFRFEESVLAGQTY